MKELEGLQISGNMTEQSLWVECMDLMEKSFVPQKQCGNERPCEEDDYREYRMIIDRNLQNIKSMLQHIILYCNKSDLQAYNDNTLVRSFAFNLIYLIGEHHEKNVWNTEESVSISKELIANFCQLYQYESISQFLMGHNNLSMILEKFRYKLRKDSWKTYPSAVAWYKWILNQVEKQAFCDHIHEILPTALLIVDDYVPENVVIGLECLYQIIQHSDMNKNLIDTGYADVIFRALQALTYERKVILVKPVYACLGSLLAIMEHWNNDINVLEWTKRDHVLARLLSQMQLEQDVELRYSYMSSLPLIITNIGCGKFCERIAVVLARYCQRYIDLRVLKVTLQVVKTYLMMFRLQVSAHCVPLYMSLLQLHIDLTDIPIFDMEIIQNLKYCICLLYELTPNIGAAIMTDDFFVTNRHFNIKLHNNKPE